MQWVLRRFGSTPFGTFGELRIPGFDQVFKTVECPWLNNKPYTSCIPLGFYDLMWLETSTSVPEIYDDHTWYMMSEHVGYRDNKYRTNCAIHKGNTQKSVTGCIAVGLEFGWIDNSWAVTNSGKAMERLFDFAGGSDAGLEIKSSRMG